MQVVNLNIKLPYSKHGCYDYEKDLALTKLLKTDFKRSLEPKKY